MTERKSPTNEKAFETLGEVAAERAAELEQNRSERYNESDKAEAVDRARAETQEALFAQESKATAEKTDATPPTGTMPVITRQDRKESYDSAMLEVRKQLKPSDRAFSKFIHSNAVERLSELGGSTLARPNSILAGGLFAFVGVLCMYVFARHNGFALSGFETIAAFTIGWVIGVLFDFLRLMIRGKR